jgi:hypothetical protein
MTSSENLKELNTIIKEQNTTPQTPCSDIKNKINLENIMNKNDAFIFKTANMFLTVLVLSSLFDVLCNYSKTGIVAFIINLCLLHFYNMNNNMCNDFDTFLTGQMFLSILDILRVNMLNLFSFLTLKTQNISIWLFDKLFSKSTQFVLKFIFKIVKNKILSKYEFYRNKLFNPQLLNETNSEYVYCVPFYLNGVNYKVPIVVEKHKTKNPPLMILNKDEEDITIKLNEFLGPNYDFFGMILKPKHFAEKTLSFMMEDGSEITIEEHDLMVL